MDKIIVNPDGSCVVTLSKKERETLVRILGDVPLHPELNLADVVGLWTRLDGVRHK